MKQKNTPAPRIRLLAVAAQMALIGLPALAQNMGQIPAPGSAGTVNAIRDAQRAPALPGAPVVAPKASASASSLGMDRRLVLSRVDVQGNTQISSAELLSAAGINLTYGPASLTLADLQNAANAMTALYRARGYAVATVQLLSQEVSSGRVVLTATEGALSAITTLPANLPKATVQRLQAVAQAAVPVDQRKALRQADVERAIMLAGELTHHQVEGTLVPGAALGTTAVELNAQAKKGITGYWQIDNAGSDTTGKVQLSGQVAGRNVATLGDTLAVNAMVSQDASSLNGFGASYEAPVGVSGWRAGARASQSNYTLGGAFSALNYEGESTAVGAYASYAVQRRFESIVDWRFGMNAVNLEDRIGTSALNTKDRSTNVVWTDVRGSFNDRGLGQPAFNQWGISLNAGNLKYGTAAQTTADASGLKTAGSYQVVGLDYLRDQGLGGGWTVLLNLRSQMANKNLDSYHKFSLGGPSAVRAFAGGEAAGDQGYVARMELAHTMPVKVSSGASASSRVAVFYDAGRVDTNHTPLAANTATNSAKRAGYGLQWQWSQRPSANAPEQFNVRLFLAKPTGTVEKSVVDNKSSRVGLELAYAF